MKAAICYEINKPLVIEEITLDKLGKGDVKVRMAACAICHSDIHSLKGEHNAPPLPAIPGHELSGYVEEVGEGVTYVKPGDHVVGSIIPEGCGQCYYCRKGHGDMCTTNRLALYTKGREFTKKKGVQLGHFAGAVAGFTEYAVIPEVNLVKVPDDLPMDRACLLACGVISGWGAVMNRAKVLPGQNVCVVGAGGVGLNAIQGAVHSGAYPIIAVDILDSKLETARKFGATHTVNSKTSKDPIKEVIDITYGRGADYVFQVVAGIPILRQCVNMAERNGTIVCIGHGFNEHMTDFQPLDFMGGKKLTGSAMGAAKLRMDIAKLIELYRAGRLKLDELISGHFPFVKINEAIEQSAQGTDLRNIIMFG
jgi:S-(hydroxymethyl)glutathione dehydrogenase / alcohol dehydrogenase